MLNRLHTLWAVALQEPPVDLSAAFHGSSVRDAAVFLWFIYSPNDTALPRSLAALAAQELAAVAALAHKLKAGGLLGQIEGFLQGKCQLACSSLRVLPCHTHWAVPVVPHCMHPCAQGRPPTVEIAPFPAGTADKASMQSLLATLQIALACQFQALEERCLRLMGVKLAAAGGQWEAVVQQGALADLPSSTLVRLLGKTAESVGRVSRGPSVLDVRDGRGGSVGGFTFAIPGFSKHQGVIKSPWVEVGGFEWRLEVRPPEIRMGREASLSGDKDAAVPGR